jgi:hypothetical protein
VAHPLTSVTPLVKKLAGITPPAQTVPSSSLPGTFTYRTGVVLALNATNGQETLTVSGSLVNGLWVGPNTPRKFICEPQTCVVALGPTTLPSVPWLGSGFGTSPSFPIICLILTQPPLMYALPRTAAAPTIDG